MYALNYHSVDLVYGELEIPIDIILEQQQLIKRSGADSEEREGGALSLNYYTQ